ncbi:hypothetical protein AOPFMNJM_3267 [Methylobacterium jeotgali]|uniref:Uncharacterized protein n=1 Tax=Methylobacterium jeotgali TaxID=381630 RepID=A0ABQ4SXJ8_9HYPH|nr:hypothetical protein AwMethylo_32720 [Methylobacterium sp.]GJE07935.1 hypothetical protein AOPFMNJM_3267 [Methylobacterium jeotgali]
MIAATLAALCSAGLLLGGLCLSVSWETEEEAEPSRGGLV